MLDTHHSDIDAEVAKVSSLRAGDDAGDMDYDGDPPPPPPDPPQPPPDYPGGAGPDGRLPAPGDPEG